MRGSVHMTALPRQAVLLLCLSLKIALSWAFDVHVADIQPPSTLIFNASLGRGWTYSLDSFRSSRSGLNLVRVESSTGHVVLEDELRCNRVTHNPFTVFVMAKTIETWSSTNYTLIPVTVHVHGENCYIKFRRKSDHHRQPTQLVSAQLDTTRGACLPKGQHILSFQDYLPSNVQVCNFQYMLANVAPNPAFLLNPYTGHLWTAEPLCMKLAYRILHVELESPCGTPELHNTSPVKIVLYAKDNQMDGLKLSQIHGFMDSHPKLRKRRQTMNTETPSFDKHVYVLNVPEELGAGFAVDTVTATDLDSGDAGRISYSLLAYRDGRSQNMFAIDPASGQITTTQKLDREKMSVHYFQLIASDHGTPKRSAMTTVTIYVEDVNDHSPTFENEQYSQAVSESFSVGATVITVRAEDADFGANAEIEYSILNRNDAFHIDSRSGSITTREKLDREVEDHYVLRIQAADKALVTERRTATADVEIIVLDENDNKPLFSKSSYTVDVSEDIDPRDSPVIAEIRATDADDGANGQVRYSITGGNYLNTFAIDDITGQLSVLEPLDYETVQVFRLSVRAQDGGLPARSNSTNVLVRVMDVNDNDPRFYTSIYQESVPENMPVGSTIIRVTAYDNDAGLNSAILYSLRDAPADMPMEIDTNTGSLIITRELDREEEKRYHFKVVAKDQGAAPRSAEANIEVSVRDINDNAPIFDPRVYNELISEETMPGTPVVAVTAKDLDEDNNARVTYSITSGNVKGAFNIISQMGQGLITVARILNFKEQSRYILTVQAVDPGNLIDTATVFINVSDANTYRPIFQGTPYQIRVDENTAVGTSVFVVSATDQDSGENARITFAIDVNEAFQVNPNTGELITKKALDRESTPGYTLTVTASDNGRPRKSDTTDIEVVIADVNDNAPKFLQAVYDGKVMEDAISGTSVLTISATDDDIDLNGRIRYTFEGGDSGNGDFMLDPTLGILRTAKELDREKVASYALRAFAIDRGAMPKSTSVVINIVVEDVNDNAPEFDAPRMDLYVAENSPIGTLVGEVEAVDPDDVSNADVEYSIVGGVDANSFSLITKSRYPASITTLIELDYEGSKNEYDIVVRARSYHLFSDVTVAIHVQDINDNVPQLKDFEVIFNNYKDHFPTGNIGKIPAFDPDVTDQLHYRFIAGNQANLLHLDEYTGNIRLDSRLNSDVATNATLQVSVTDGINEVKAVCRLFVRLVTKDMLDNSITIRLNNMDQQAFLSPLYHMFLGALAGVIPTTEDNVFIVNVQDDFEVREQILNISFSVRQKKDSIKDVFYSSQFLRERVYLQRVLLAKLSTLEVLPFDDNLCVIEPCLNFDECLTFLRFGNASSFITSDTMLFRPIHPTNYFKCQCPKWFTGMSSSYLCDTEVNLCYSDPCRHDGTCIQREGGFTCLCQDGFTGDQCEIDMRQTKTCPEGVCKSGSSCIPLIRGGFRCERCLDDAPGSMETKCELCSNIDYHTNFCELTTRSFPKGSFLLYPSLKRRHRFSIQLSFATRERNALLFYNGRYNEEHDFIALEIVGGQVQFSFSLGTDISTVKADIDGGVNDGSWHQVTVQYLNRTAILTVGDWCDTQLSIKYGRQIGDYSCSSQVTQVLEARCSDVTETCHRFLDLTGPLQLGGLPSSSADFQIQNKDFVGCMKDFYIDQNFLDLNDFVWNSNTVEGCPAKRSFCMHSPCQNDGTCFEAWDSYRCDCQTGWGGKDCSLKIDSPQSLAGNSYLKYINHGLSDVRVPWYNGINFRTRQTKASLMEIHVGAGTRSSPKERIHINIMNGNIHYVHPKKTIVLDGVLVNDGKWHYLEARWQNDNSLIITLDYGQIRTSEEMGDWVNGLPVGEVTVGGQVSSVGGSVLVSNGFEGCVKDVRVGHSVNSVLTDPDEEANTVTGCAIEDTCEQDAFPCPDNSYCNNEWGTHTCTCESGRIGKDCDKICAKFDPCVNGGTCSDDATAPDGYRCVCPPTYSGMYCEIRVNQPCPANWYSGPNGICGPCDCPTHRGFDPHCNITVSGEKNCFCKDSHYRPIGSHTCFPCDCYELGSEGRHCDLHTGQCHCKSGVIGRRCDSCSSKFAQVTERGCEVVYDSCPRSFKDGIWWERTLFPEEVSLDNVNVSQNCPDESTGIATRVCNRENGWGEPQLFNCLSDTFTDLARQLKHIDQRDLLINTYVSKSLMTSLNETTNITAPLYGTDINITYHLLRYILEYENQQTGLNLTHKQDRNFIQNLVATASLILEPEYKKSWQIIQQQGGGTVDLMSKLELYTRILAQNMAQLFTEPFDAVHDNMVIGLDYIGKGNYSSHISVPKFNNKVKTKNMFDEDTHVLLSDDIVKSQGSQVEVFGGQQAMMIVSYVMYKTIGDLLPDRYDEDTVRVLDTIPLSVNSPVFTLNLLAGNKSVKSSLAKPLVLDFKQAQTFNRSSPQCAYFKYTTDSRREGVWSTEGCTLEDRRSELNKTYVTCSCDHLTSFAILMDMSSEEVSTAQSIGMEIVTYVGLSVSLLLLLASMVLFCCLRGLNSNANSIHINLIFCIFVSHLAFLVGINRTEPKIGCKIVAIALHYFYMTVFAWMFVEALHLYRMMTEIRNINQGSMKFYYLIGYVIPGIIAGLAVGLNTDGYGNSRFCWLDTQDFLIWSFAGPVCCVICINIVVFIMALRASCQKTKQDDPEFRYLKYGLRASIMLLPLLGLAWVFGLLAVNDNVATFHYLFAIFSLLQGFFIFFVYIVLCKETRRQLHYAWHKMKGEKSDESIPNQRSRSVLSYHRGDSSLEGGLNRLNIGVSTTSSTSQSTSKSSGGMYHPDGYLHTSSTSTSANLPTHSEYHPQAAGIPAYGYDSSAFHDKPADDPDTGEPRTARKRRDSDSDSELSAMEHPDMELASSHSSDDDDEDAYSWNKSVPKSKLIESGRVSFPPRQNIQVSPRGEMAPPIPPHPTPPQSYSVNTGYQHSPTRSPPPYSSVPTTPQKWPGEGLSTNVGSDTEQMKNSPNHIKISEKMPLNGILKNGTTYREREPISPPERTDSLPPKYDSVGPSPRSLPRSPRDRMTVKVLTHNGSISESESASSSDSGDLNWG